MPSSSTGPSTSQSANTAIQPSICFLSRIFSMLLPDEIAGIAIEEGGNQRRPSDTRPRLKAKFLACFPLHFVVEHPDRDIDRAGALAFAAVGAASSQMHGARHEIGDILGTRRRPLDPLDAAGLLLSRGSCGDRESDAVHHTFVAVAHRAHRTTREAAHAAVEMATPLFPAFTGALRFETRQRGERRFQLAPGLVLAEHDVVFLGIGGAAFQTTIRQHLARRHTLLAYFGGKHKIVAIKSGVCNMCAIRQRRKLALIQHPGALARYADDVDV